jgi:hypothetical protein
MRLRPLLVACLLVALAVAAGGCMGGDDDDRSVEPTATTPASVKTAVYERSLSECFGQTVEQLARAYKVEARQGPVATAVAARWVDRLNGEHDAVQSGRDGCMLGFQQRAAENAGQS